MYVLGGSAERSVRFAPRREHVGLARRQQADAGRRETEDDGAAAAATTVSAPYR